MASTRRAVTGWAATVRGLFLVAMALFVVTIAIGIVNGLDLYEFNHDQLLTHVHSGTLGWITLGSSPARSGSSGPRDRRLAIVLAVLIPLYVAAFYSGNLPARAVTGTALLVAILWLVGWAWRRPRREPTIPLLAVTLGLTTFAYGAIIGVLIQVQLASRPNLFPASADAIGAHAGTMVFSYLILVAMGLLEWRPSACSGPRGAGWSRSAGCSAAAAPRADPALPRHERDPGGRWDLPAGRARGGRAVRGPHPADRRPDRLADRRAPTRHLATSAGFVIVATGIFLYVVFLFISTGDPSKIPTGVLVASDHAAFIGVITNPTFGPGPRPGRRSGRPLARGPTSWSTGR